MKTSLYIILIIAAMGTNLRSQIQTLGEDKDPFAEKHKRTIIVVGKFIQDANAKKDSISKCLYCIQIVTGINKYLSNPNNEIFLSVALKDKDGNYAAFDPETASAEDRKAMLEQVEDNRREIEIHNDKGAVKRAALEYMRKEMKSLPLEYVQDLEKILSTIT